LPLLFNLCFNMLNTPDYRSLWYTWGVHGHRRSWFQFADDAAIVGSDTKSSQALFNLCVAWCTWSCMDLRLDKCCTFWMEKRNRSYEQFQPIHWVDSRHILPVEISHDFRYLEKLFSLDTNNRQMENKLNLQLNITFKLAVRPQTKLMVLQMYINAQMSFEVKLYDLPLAWIDQTLDALSVSQERLDGSTDQFLCP